MRYNYKDAPNGVVLWAYGYAMTYEKDNKSIHAKPYKCIKNGTRVYKLKKDGTKSKSSVSHWSRDYADTYEEAVVGLNKDVDSCISELKKLIQYHETEKI